MNLETVIHSRGKNVYKVRIEASNKEYTGGYSRTLQVRGDNWGQAKRYVEDMDPHRLWVDYGAVLRECGYSPRVCEVWDRNKVYYSIDLRY